MISILLPAYNSEELLWRIFLKSFHNNCSDPTELIIYDNGGNKGSTLAWKVRACGTFETLGKNDIKVIGNKENVGLNKALNECAKVATGDYFFLPHTDMFLLPGWDIALLEAAKNLPPKSFLFCSRSIEPGFSHIKSQIIKDYGNDVSNFREEDLLKDYKQLIENKIVVNARMPFFMHRKLWEAMSGVDPHYFSYCTDDDLIQTAYDVGVRKFYMIYDSLVYHLQGKSNNQQTVDKDKNEPYEYFVNKWKSKYPDVSHPGQYHPKLLPFEKRIK